MAFNEATIQNGNVLFSSDLMKCKFQHIISFSKLSFIASLSVLTDLFVYFSLKALRLPISQTVWAWLALRSMFQFVESTVIRLDKIQFTSCHRAQDFIVLLRGRKKKRIRKKRSRAWIQSAKNVQCWIRIKRYCIHELIRRRCSCHAVDTIQDTKVSK